MACWLFLLPDAGLKYPGCVRVGTIFPVAAQIHDNEWNDLSDHERFYVFRRQFRVDRVLFTLHVGVPQRFSYAWFPGSPPQIVVFGLPLEGAREIRSHHFVGLLQSASVNLWCDNSFRRRSSGCGLWNSQPWFRKAVVYPVVSCCAVL